MLALPTLEELRAQIREARLRLGLSQNRLAREAGVSQSLVNKFERGLRIPTYDHVERLARHLEALLARKLEDRAPSTLGEVCTWDVVTVRMGESVATAAERMQAGGFSQLPTVDDEAVVGRVDETSLHRLLWHLEKEGQEHVSRHRLRDHPEVVKPPFAIMDETQPLARAFSLIEQDGAVLVARSGEVEGIATRADLLKLLLSSA